MGHILVSRGLCLRAPSTKKMPRRLRLTTCWAVHLMEPHSGQFPQIWSPRAAPGLAWRGHWALWPFRLPFPYVPGAQAPQGLTLPVGHVTEISRTTAPW